MATLTYDKLLGAVQGVGIGIRSRTAFEPLGGPGDKIFPPTYGGGTQATKYATERRRVDGENKDCVLLDSVASQANRFELALLEAVRRGELALPLVSVDFGNTGDLADLDRLSALEAPHRVYDAILRDSFLDKTLFRLSDIGRSITEATPRSAAALFHHCPTTLLFGGWDSTGPKGGRGSKFERAITSEVVAIGIATGCKTASRIDPLGIEVKAATLYECDDELGWTLDEGEAVKEKGKARLIKGSGEGPAGRPSQKNHGNVMPAVDGFAGGVTADEIVATTVLSFAALRRLRFPFDTAGRNLTGVARSEAEGAAHAALAALGLAATVLAHDEGFDLRSRCVLAPTGPLEFELLQGGGAEPERFTLARADALKLVHQAASTTAERGLAWREGELLLRPADRLVDLVRRSRRLAEREPALAGEE